MTIGRRFRSSSASAFLRPALKRKNLVVLTQADVQKLLIVIKKLVDSGNTIIVIEHNLDVWTAADWIIDLGPKGGQEGGKLLCQNTPKNLTLQKSSTGIILKKHLCR